MTAYIPSAVRTILWTKRWAMTPFKFPMIRYKGTPIVAKRCGAVQALLVCNVEKTLCPVFAICVAIRAVSSSRILAQKHDIRSSA